MNFTIIDWIIIIVFLAGNVFVGLYAKRFIGDLSGYLVAGRRLKIGIGTATIIATELGTVTIMYMGESGYHNGFAALIFGIICLVAYMIVGRTGFIIEGLRRLRVMTVPEFYTLRYSRTVRIIGGFILFLGGTLNMGVFLKLDGVFLSHAMGFGDAAIATIMIIMITAVGLYTIFGGMLSIAVTSYLQYTVISVSMLVATIFVFKAVSIESIAEAVSTNLGSHGFNPLTNPSLGWTFIFWMLLSNLAVSALWQPVTSRALSAENARTGRRIYNIASFTFAGRAMIPMIWGIAALTMFPGLTGSEALTAVPRMLGTVLPTGIIGILVAGMLAASMSTYSSYLLAPASVITRDVIGASFNDRLTDKTIMLITRIWVGILGVFLVVFGLLYSMPDTALKYLYITGNMYTAGAASAVGFGLYWKKANNVGAYTAIITGVVSPVAFLLLANLKDTLPASIAWLVDANISGFLSFFIGAVGMIVGSLLTQKICPPKDISHLFEKRE